MKERGKRLLSSAPPGEIDLLSFDNPLDVIAEDHMQEREICASIDRIVALRKVPAGPGKQIITFLEKRLPPHLLDEELDLFPMMIRRCPPEDEIEKVIAKLQDDHGHASTDAPAVVRVLKQAGDGLRVLSRQAGRSLTEFAHHARRHLILENAIILPIARLRLRKRDLTTIRKHMFQRRGIAMPSRAGGG